MVCFAALGDLLDEEIDARYMGMYMCTYSILYIHIILSYISYMQVQTPQNTSPDIQHTSPDTRNTSPIQNTIPDIQNTIPDIKNTSLDISHTYKSM